MYTSSRNMYVVMCRCTHPVETCMLLCADVHKEEELSCDVNSCYFFVDEPATQRSLTSTAPVVQPMGEGHHRTICKRSFYRTSSQTHPLGKVQSKKTVLDNEQEQEEPVIRVTDDEIDVNTTVTMKSGATKHCMQSYMCRVCHERFDSKALLKIHMLSHRDANTSMFTCTHCSYQSRHGSKLTRHMCTHTGEKPFACTSCSYRCSGSENLTSHMRTHTGKKRFACSSCSY